MDNRKQLSPVEYYSWLIKSLKEAGAPNDLHIALEKIVEEYSTNIRYIPPENIEYKDIKFKHDLYDTCVIFGDKENDAEWVDKMVPFFDTYM